MSTEKPEPTQEQINESFDGPPSCPRKGFEFNSKQPWLCTRPICHSGPCIASDNKKTYAWWYFGEKATLFTATRTPIPATGGEKEEEFQKGGDESCAHQSEPPIRASNAPVNVQSVDQGQGEYDRLKAQKDAIIERENEKLRNEGRSDVIMIRCLKHQSVPQYNHSACGSECGACIAAPPAQGEKDAEIARPKVVCLCGSSKHPELHMRAMMTETLAGNIVVPMGLYGHADFPKGAKAATNDGDESTAVKQMLDTLHHRKIDLADEVLVLTVGGYIGSSTRREIEYAEKTGKSVRISDISESDLATVRAESAAKDAIIEEIKRKTQKRLHGPIEYDYGKYHSCGCDKCNLLRSVIKDIAALARAEEAVKEGK